MNDLFWALFCLFFVSWSLEVLLTTNRENSTRLYSERTDTSLPVGILAIAHVALIVLGTAWFFGRLTYAYAANDFAVTIADWFFIALASAFGLGLGVIAVVTAVFWPREW